MANQFDVPIKWIEVCADDIVIRKRISKKRKYSEADYDVFQVIKASFEPVLVDHIKLYSDREKAEEMIDKAIHYINL